MSRETLEHYTYNYLMSLALSFVADDRDKRQGSVIYDALAPFCQLLAAGAMELSHFYEQTYAVTATGEDLDNRVAEQGVSRLASTYAVKKAEFLDTSGNPMYIPISARFSTVSDTNPINYVVTAQYVDEKTGKAVPGSYQLTCEELGVIGNEYSGNLINITFIQGLASAYMSTTLVPARDEETDKELRERYFDALNQKAFGGNIADYRTKLKEEVKGVGAVQIYPVWKGGGTVKLSIIDPQYNICSPDFVLSVQNEMDPENARGEKGTGLGIAPIGHKVTVVTPEKADIRVSATIALQADYELGQVSPLITEALKEYIKSLRESWGDASNLNTYSCNVFISRISSAIVNTPGVANVTGVELNDLGDDISLIENSDVQQLPELSKVTLNGEVVFDVQQTA